MEDEMDDEYEEALKEVKGKRSILKLKHKMKRFTTAYPKTRQLSDMKESMEE